MEYAPIVIFAYNRLESLSFCVSSLLRNVESKDSDLIVFVDGARLDKSNEEEKVRNVRSYVESIRGFRSLKYSFSDQNKGLGPSVISGVSEVLDKYEKAIIIEDDLVVSDNFLSYMNQGLEVYNDIANVFSICGYTNMVTMPKDYPFDAYFCVRSSSWGWATWKDRWESVDWELKDWTSVEKHSKAFNRWGGSDCYKMLKGWKRGSNQSWAIRFCYAQFVQNKLSLFPTISKIENKGFDGNGTNCKKWTRYKSCFDLTNNKRFNFPNKIETIDSIIKSALSYHSLLKRVYSRFMYIFYK